MEDGQVKTTTTEQVETKVETPDTVVETPVIEQIGQLLNPDNQPVKAEETPETIVDEPQGTIPTPEPIEPKQEAIVDEAMITQYPTLKMYLGKPQSDIPRAYHNIVMAYKKDHEELIKLKQEQAKKSIPKPDEFPDPIDKPEEFKKALADYTKQIREQTLLEAQNQPQPIDWVQEVGKVLPQGVDTKSVIDEFTKFNASRFYDKFANIRPEIARFYDENPEILLDEIRSFHSMYSNANKTNSTIAKESKETAYKTITNSLKKAQENKDDLKGAQFNATERSTQMTQEDEILAKIFTKVQGR